MLVTKYTRDLLAARRQRRRLQAQGYERHDVRWLLPDERIVAAEVAADGRGVYLRCERLVPTITPEARARAEDIAARNIKAAFE